MVDSAEALPALVSALGGVALSGAGQMSVNGIWTAAVAEHLEVPYTSVSSAFTIGALLGGVVILFIGDPIDRLGPRWSTLLFMPFFCGSVALIGFVEDPWQYGCCAFFFRALAKGIDISAKTALARNFDRYRGRAVGLVNTFGLGGVVLCALPLLVTHLIATQGLRKASTLVAAGTAAGLVLVAVGLRPLRSDSERMWTTTAVVNNIARQTLHRSETRAIKELNNSMESGLATAGKVKPRMRRAVTVESVGQAEYLLALRRVTDPTSLEILQSRNFWFLSAPGALMAVGGTTFFFFLPAIGASLQLENYQILYPAFALGSVLANLVGGFLIDQMSSKKFVIGLLFLQLMNMLMFAFGFGWAIPGFTFGAQDGITQVLGGSLFTTYFGKERAAFAQAANMALLLFASGLCPFFVATLQEQGLLQALWLSLAAIGFTAATLVALRMQAPMTVEISDAERRAVETVRRATKQGKMSSVVPEQEPDSTDASVEPAKTDVSAASPDLTEGVGELSSSSEFSGADPDSGEQLAESTLDP